MAPDSPQRFLLHRLITDSIGHCIAAYVTLAFALLIDPHSDSPGFNHTAAVCYAAVFVVSDFVIARVLGNRKWFGLIALLVASFVGFAIFTLACEPFLARTDVRFTPSIEPIGFFIFYAAFVLPPALIFPLITRLMAWPIVSFFRKGD